MQPFESVTVADVPDPLGMPETVTVLPLTETVPAVAEAVNGPIPEFTASTMEYVSWLAVQVCPVTSDKTGLGLTVTVAQAVSRHPCAFVTITE
jgi:hypothetical protein